MNDDATGWQQLGARLYIPGIGRFLTQDPIGQEGGLNLYAYCGNSPLMRTDAAGLWPQIHGAWISGDTTFPANLASPGWMGAIAWARHEGHIIDTFNGPSRAQMISILSSDKYDYVTLMGHGGFGDMYYGLGRSYLTAHDINQIADARDRAGIARMNTISVYACLVMGDRAMVNALLRIAGRVRGFEGFTVSTSLSSLGHPGDIHTYTEPFPRGSMSGRNDDTQYLWKKHH